MTRHTWLWAVGFYLLSLCVYTIFSYSLTAPNLILSSASPYWRFQLWMWKTFFNDRQLLTYTYSALLTAVFAGYFLTIKSLRSLELSKKMVIGVMLVCAFPLLLANNALSYDVFNYIFNAKMVAAYHTNPHQHVALDFAYDDWTRFMHNTHTTAPYGYGWTILSLLPYTLGMGKFTLTWLIFRVFSLMSLWLLARVYLSFITDKQRWWALAVLINPLILIEIITNSHNDLWMMVPAVVSLALVSRQTAGWKHLIVSVLLLSASIFIKLATIVLVPVWLVVLVGRGKAWHRYWPLLASAAMLSLLLTSRSQQFHPWYLSWVLVWLPFIEVRMWRWSLVVLSISSMFRYIPYLWHGEYTPHVLVQQKLTTWIPWLIITIGILAWRWRALLQRWRSRRKATTITS